MGNFYSEMKGDWQDNSDARKRDELKEGGAGKMEENDERRV